MNFYLIHRVLPVCLLVGALVFFVAIVVATVMNPGGSRSLKALQGNLSMQKGNYALMDLELVIRRVKKDFRFTHLMVAVMFAIASVLGAILLLFYSWP